MTLEDFVMTNFIRLASAAVLTTACASAMGQGLLRDYSSGSMSLPSLASPSAVSVNIPSVYTPLTPCRLADTRKPGVVNSAFGTTTGEEGYFWAWGPTQEYHGGRAADCGVPGNATAIHANFTVVSPTAPGFLRAWPFGLNEPQATLFAWNAGFGAANAATIPFCSSSTSDVPQTDCVSPVGLGNPVDALGGTQISEVDFKVKIYSDDPTDLVIDVFGYYAPATP